MQGQTLIERMENEKSHEDNFDEFLRYYVLKHWADSMIKALKGREDHLPDEYRFNIISTVQSVLLH